MRLIAGLPGNNAIVGVGPPLSAVSGPSRGSTPLITFSAGGTGLPSTPWLVAQVWSLTRSWRSRRPAVAATAQLTPELSAMIDPVIQESVSCPSETPEAPAVPGG